MSLTQDIVLMLGGVVLGGITSYIVPILLRRAQYKGREDILGMWHSSYHHYQDAAHPAGTWVTEVVDIQLHHSQFQLRNSQNSIADDYLAYGTITRGCHLAGEWRSIRRAAHADGAFILTIQPLGSIMYGYFTGPRDTGERIYGAWVLARRASDLDKGKELLRRTTLPKRNSSGYTPAEAAGAT